MKHLIFLKSDRASRNGVDSAALVFMAEREGFNIHLIQDCLLLNNQSKPTDFLIFEITNCMSNFYPRNLSVDVSTKMREKAEQGYYPSHAPVGYKNERISRRSYLQINPEKAPLIRRIFELYSTGNYSYITLAKQLREEGLKVSDAVNCGKSNIADILNNPLYIGDFIWNGKRYYNGKHEPIISRELFAICQKIIKSRTSSRTTKRDFIYSNTIRCKKCGCFLVAELKKGKYVYYHCTGNKGGDCKKGSYVREEKIEKAILEVFDSFKLSDETLKMARKGLKNEFENQNYYNETRIKSLENDVEKAKNRLNKLFDLYLDGEVLEEIYKKKSTELQNEIEDMSMRLVSYTRTGFELLCYSESLFELCTMASELYLRGNTSEKRDLLKIVCSNFYYDGENVIIAIKKAFQPLVKIASLEMVEQNLQNSNFISCIKELITELQNSETILFLEKFKTLKRCA